MHTFTLLGNGTVISKKRDSGVWIRTLTTSGDATYKCMADNSVGVTSSNYITFTVEGETKKILRIILFFLNIMKNNRLY